MKSKLECEINLEYKLKIKRLGERYMPRVIAGIVGGIPLKAPVGDKTRPTTDRIKESVFNVLQPYLDGDRVLDLFAGSGSLGIEALSRGFTKAVFVDADNSACLMINENLKKTHLYEQAEIMCLDIEPAIKKIHSRNDKMDLVFADPPYLHDFVLKMLLLLTENDIMVNNGIVVVEHHRKESAPDKVGQLELFKRKEYGETIFSFYNKTFNETER